MSWFQSTAWRWLSCAAVAVSLILAPRASSATPDEIDKSIKKGVEWLYNQQDESGSWDFILKPNENGKWSGVVKQAGGPSALAIYALLTCGENPKDPRIIKGIDYLRKTQSGGTYAIGFRANAYAAMPPDDTMKRLIAADGQWIKNAVRLGKDVKLRGFYGYGSGPKSGSDRSTSQIAVLGAWGCAQAGINLGDEYWRLIEDAWRKNQSDDGGWNYSHDRSTAMSMTSAGVATLFITQEYLHAADFSECKGNYTDPAIEKGLKWMGEHFGQFAETQQYYTLYAIERTGYASGYKYFGEHNWFVEGSDWLLKNQAADGSWGGTANFNTSFALLFLGRGRSPVALTKLQYGKDDVGETVKNQEPTEGNWNARPRDAANICKWTGKQQERVLNYETVSIDAPIQELQDSPILYISGNQPLKFSDEKVAKLRTFVEEGGLVVGNADCSNKMFVESFKKIGADMFPTYEWRVIPQDHPILANQQYLAKNWKNPPAVLGLSNGSRELVILFNSGDPGKYWQLHMYSGKEEQHQVMADVFGYAIEREGSHYKGATHIVRKNDTVQADRTMKIARLKYPGNWDPEPGAWRRMTNLLHNTQKLDLTVDTVELGSGSLDATNYPLAHLTGTAAYALPANARNDLKKYVEAGGTLLVDACGGATAFSTGIEPELATLFAPGKPALDVLPPEHKLFAGDVPYMLVDVPKVKEVEYRPFAKPIVGTTTKTPLLRGAAVKDRVAVFFSREDLTSGMVGMAIDGIVGYTPKSATTIVERLVLSLAPKPNPKPKEGEENKPAEEAKPAEEPKPAPEAKPAEEKKPTEEKKAD